MRRCKFGVFTNNQDSVHIRVLDKLSADRVNVGLVVRNTVVGNGILAVTGKRGAVTVWQVIDDENTGNGRASTGGVLGLDIGKVSSHGRDLGGGVAIEVISTGASEGHCNRPTAKRKRGP